MDVPGPSPEFAAAEFAPDDYVQPLDYNEDGVDLTLIREFLRLTPAERLAVVDGWLEVLVSVRRPSGERVYAELEADDRGVGDPRG